MASKVVGIVTLWDSPVNYGQVLQGFALSAVLVRLGYSPFIVRYTLKEEIAYDTFGMKVKRVLTGKKSVVSILKRYTSKSEKQVNRHFDDFRKTYINYSKRSYDSYQELVDGYQEADVYVVGSDQVWGASGSINKKRIFLLDFLPDSVRRISYAASFGRNDLAESEVSLFRDCLTKFFAISVREETGCAICKRLGIGTEAQWVLDPTVLLDRKEWIDKFKLPLRRGGGKIAFAYMLTNDEKNRCFYNLFSQLEQCGYEVRYVSSAYYLDNKATCNPTIEQWLAEMLSADIVITSSYHGTLFALNFNTPFVFLPKSKGPEGENSRLYSLLAGLGLVDRIVENPENLDLKALLSETIDWESVNLFFAEKRLYSFSYLKESLGQQQGEHC